MEYQSAAALASTSRAEARSRCAAVAYLLMSVMGSLWFSGVFTIVWQAAFLVCALPLAFMGAKAVHDAVLIRMLDR